MYAPWVVPSVTTPHPACKSGFRSLPRPPYEYRQPASIPQVGPYSGKNRLGDLQPLPKELRELGWLAAYGHGFPGMVAGVCNTTISPQALLAGRKGCTDSTLCPPFRAARLKFIRHRVNMRIRVRCIIF